MSTPPRTLFGHPSRDTTTTFYPEPWTLDTFERDMKDAIGPFAQNMRNLGGQFIEPRYPEQWVEMWMAWNEIETEKANHHGPDLAAFWHAHSQWSQATFGTDSERGPTGPLKHLRKEVDEALANPGDASKLADLLFLTFDAACRSGLTYEQLVAAAWAKLEVNKARKWTPPTKDDEAVEHVRD